MRIVEVKTFLVDASRPSGAWKGERNWLFVKVETDEGICGLGEGSGWPRVVETAVKDLTPLEVKDGHIEAPKGPGLGVDLDERVAAEHPSRGNVTPPNEETLQATYYQTRARRGRLFR